jgi:hypothetical protein
MKPLDEQQPFSVGWHRSGSWEYCYVRNSVNLSES